MYSTPIQNKEAFVYCWTDFGTNKLYVGVHKGTPEDGYICSSKLMLQEYKKRPYDFSREIVAFGSYKEMYIFETALLKGAKADKDPGFYNQHLNNGKFFRQGPTAEKTKILLSAHKNDPNEKIANSLRVKKTWDASPTRKVKLKDRMKNNKYASGSKHTEGWRIKQSIRMRATPWVPKIVGCPHCSTFGENRIMKRWHFDKCKKKGAS